MLGLESLRRVVLASAWIGIQGALILTGGRRADGAFAFRMFPESSTIRVELTREIDAPTGHGYVTTPVTDGSWLAHDAHGMLHRFRWDDRVQDTNLYPWGTPVHASYGAEAQVERLGRALDDVATHIPDDAETHRLIANVTIRKNGRGPEQRTLTSRERR